ncbi:MAG: hypothetical protein QF578_16505 [Alphaproteobacteria bacterium]|jgi:hypothetical protein|nr:hypothetical protein [Alphaproteobacteria bacterium]MDP6566432.1 hypothetical protein [Alphaproteobacteria bacterium]MDP6811610.1 hypothetical protein [Alphaproteobacteria bacterium]
MRRLIPAGLLLLAISALPGCGLFPSEEARPCPRVSLLNDAGRLIAYREGPGRDLTDVRYEARVEDVNWACGYTKNRLRVAAKIDIVATRGPASRQGKISVPFFVAITGGDQQILAKQAFKSELVFPKGRRRAGVREEIEQIIFLREGETGAHYEIIVGLQLSEEQLRLNRRRRF